MRLLCVASNFPRWEGDSTTPFVLHLVQDLQKIGWEVDVLAPHAQGCASVENFLGVPVRRFRYFWPDQAQSLCYQGGMLINLRRNPLVYLQLPAFLLAETIGICRALSMRRYDLVHSHCLLPQGFCAGLATKLYSVPHVTTIHGSDVFGLQGKLYPPFKRFALRHADAVTANSAESCRMISLVEPQLPHLHRVFMGVEPPWEKTLKRAEEIRAVYGQEGRPLCLFVGRIVREKGIEDLLQALILLKNQKVDLTCLVVGEGQEGREMRQLCEQSGIQERVRFVGWVDSGQVAAFHAAADLFVCPSWFEGQGLSVIEAMMAGTPVVATAVGGILDSIRDGETGLLVPPRDPAALAAAIQKCLDEPAPARARAEKAKAFALSTFTREASAQKFSDLFESVIRARKASQP